MNEISETQQAYDRIAAGWAAKWAGPGDPGRVALAEARARFVAVLPPGASVLDAGCGPGRDVIAMRASGTKVTGLDRSAGMLAEASRRGARPLVRGEVLSLPFGPRSFDGVWACACLLHLPKSAIADGLREARRVLRPGGRLYVSLKQGRGERWWDDGDGLRRFAAYYEEAEIDAILRDGSFEIREAWLSPGEPGTEPWINRLAVSAGE